MTGQAVSAADQLTDARAERDALLRSLQVAQDPDHIVRLRKQLTASREEVARRQSAVDALRRMTDTARIDLTLTGSRTAGGGAGGSDEEGRFGPGRALHDAGRALAVTAGAAIIALAILLPLGLLGGAGSFAGRSLRRRRREAALDTP